jgi:alkanesulfonate monooxygenase SsuD/methylene tetrahydromethanopterin reductase-like flavin-dependent oxidoreductase (luciferase family)
MTLDHISAGRFSLGIGAGGSGFDATTTRREPWSRRERADRFEEFVTLLDELLTEPVTTHDGRHYRAFGARMHPGCVQRPACPSRSRREAPGACDWQRASVPPG